MNNLNGKAILGVAGGVIGSALLAYGVDILVDRLTRYDAQGFDKHGFDKAGYDRYGYNAEGYNRSGYNIDGFDRHGYDEQGFDCEGYDRLGYTADGYNRDGLDRSGFNRAGYDMNGFDRYGRDADGYSRSGFSRDGFDREGLDRQGYGRNRYNNAGFDRAGHTAPFYVDYLGKLYLRLNDAKRQLDAGEYRYAIYDARLVLEEALRLVVEHSVGIENSGDKLLENLKICENKQLLDVGSDFIDRLHGVRGICNATTHEIDASERLSHEKTYFVIMQTRDFLKSAEAVLVGA